MLVFRRKQRDQIVIDGNIVITIMNIRGSRVSLGIEAPPGVRILRSELRPHEVAGVLPRFDTDTSEGTTISTPTAKLKSI